MDVALLKVVAQIAGIGGIALGVFLLIFRDMIRKLVFPNLTREQAFHIIRLILILTFALAVLGIAAWTWLQPQEQPRVASANDKAIPDFEVKPTESGFQFKLTNRGATAFNVKLDQAGVLLYGLVKDRTAGADGSQSATYDVLSSGIDSDEAGLFVRVSGSSNPNDFLFGAEEKLLQRLVTAFCQFDGARGKLSGGKIEYRSVILATYEDERASKHTRAWELGWEVSCDQGRRPEFRSRLVLPEAFVKLQVWEKCLMERGSKTVITRTTSPESIGRVISELRLAPRRC